MTDLSTKTVMVVGNGLFETACALRLREDFGRVLIFIPWVSSFPTSHLREIGGGFDGIERVDYFWDHVEEVDLFVFLDCNLGDIQVQLRKMGKRVWGGGKADEIELFRWTAKQFQKDSKLPVQPCRLIIGITALQKYLESLPDDKKVHIKLSQTRGDDETWSAKGDIVLVLARLWDFRQRLGPLADIYEFIVEDSIPDAQEYGYDGYEVLGEWPAHCAFGFEQKDELYCGCILPYDKLPDGAKKVNAALSPLFKAYNACGFYSSEIRNDILIDHTKRQPEPPGMCYQIWWKNYSQILWEGGGGKLVDIIPVKQYSWEYILYSEPAAHHWLAVKFPKEIEQFVKLYNHTRVKDVDWIVPTDSKLVQIGGVVAVGDTIAEAEKTCRGYAEQIEGDGVEIKTECANLLLDTLRESVKNGVYFGNSPIPEKI